MGVKAGIGSSSQTLASVISSPSSKQQNPLFRSNQTPRFFRPRFHKPPKSRNQTAIRLSAVARFGSDSDSFSDQEFSKRIQELAMKFQLSEDDEDQDSRKNVVDSFLLNEESVKNSIELCGNSSRNACVPDLVPSRRSFDSIGIDPPEWCERDGIILANIERKANRVELPISLRIIKRKKQWGDGLREAGESAYCSVKKAFSSMVFIIRELHSYTMQMREMLMYEDLQEMLVRVQKEMNASFVWLFQQVFSHTPTLMVYVMILLANYSVHSMACNAAIASPPLEVTESVSSVEGCEKKFDFSVIKSFSVSLSDKSVSIGGGGGGKFRRVASGTNGDGRFDGQVSSDYHRTIVPDGITSVGNPTGEQKLEMMNGEEERMWNSIVDEASAMQVANQGQSLDHETMRGLVSPVNAKIQDDAYADYLRTELLYQTGLAQEPNNPLLLANYAQFLYLVAQDYDRAEKYFKKAAKEEPKDAEALNKYATFLWQARKDAWAAEEAYLEAISVEPSNSYYAANYANFLWNTGGEDTCFPLSSTQ